MQTLNLRATGVVIYIETGNAPMRAINQKFGFVEEPGKFEMERSL